MSEPLKVIAWECRARPNGWAEWVPTDSMVIATMARHFDNNNPYWEPHKPLVYKEDAERQLRNARRVVEQLESKQKRNRGELAKAARELRRLRAEVERLRTPAATCLVCGSDSNERDELTKAEREIDQLTERARSVIAECAIALSEELTACDIDRPVENISSALERCKAWLAANSKGEKRD